MHPPMNTLTDMLASDNRKLRKAAMTALQLQTPEGRRASPYAHLDTPAGAKSLRAWQDRTAAQDRKDQASALINQIITV
jgi:hypothetical protein